MFSHLHKGTAMPAFVQRAIGSAAIDSSLPSALKNLYAKVACLGIPKALI